jgi:hypothetical protein
VNKQTNQTMIVQRIPVTSFEITPPPGRALDPIRVHLQDYGEGKGRITIECYSRAWSCFWGGMGKNTLTEFIVSASPCYIENALHSGIRHTKRDTEYLTRIVKAVQEALK